MAKIKRLVVLLMIPFLFVSCSATNSFNDKLRNKVFKDYYENGWVVEYSYKIVININGKNIYYVEYWCYNPNGIYNNKLNRNVLVVDEDLNIVEWNNNGN